MIRFTGFLLCLVFMLGCCGNAAVRIGVLKQPDFPKMAGHSDPDYLAELLKQAGYEPVMLSADDLSDAKLLDPVSMPAVVLPYGAYFPLKTVDNWRRYLHEGGSFFSTGGYAFDEPLRYNGKWLTSAEIAESEPTFISNGEFRNPDGWKITYDATAAHFGPSPEFDVGSGLVMGSADKESTVFLTQDISPLQPGPYKISVKQFAHKLEGPGFFFVTVIAYGKDGKEFWRKDICATRETDGIAPVTVNVQTDIPAESVRVEVMTALDRLKGIAGISNLKITKTPIQINSRNGRLGDGLMMADNCIGVFDASFPLRYASSAVADEYDLITPEALKIKGPFEGMVADAMVGGHSRLMPIMKALDRYNRPRGALGSLVYHWAIDKDTFYYADSAWAIWGVSNKDIFARGDEKMAKVFTETIKRLVDKVYLVHPRAELQCYRDYKGPINLYVTVRNSGRTQRSVTASIQVTDEKGKEIYKGSEKVSVPFSDKVDAIWKLDSSRKLAGGFYRIKASLELDGKLYDRLDGGFWVWDAKKVTSAVRYELKNNVFEVNGRGTYMPAMDMHGQHIDRWMDGPLTWFDDAKAMRDMGLLQYETLENWAPWGEPNPAAAWERFRAKISGEVMANCSVGLQFMPTQILAGDMIVDDKRLEEMSTATFNYFSSFPFPYNMQYYIGGDVFKGLGAEKTWLADKWSNYVKQRPDAAKLQSSNWKPRPGDAGMLMKGAWTDMMPVAWSDFLLGLEEHYNNVVGSAVRKAVPNSIMTAEYLNLPQPHPAIPTWLDPWNGRSFDISNIAVWGSIVGGGDSFTYGNLATIGKPLTVGEWGWLVHPSIGLSETDADTGWFNQNMQMFGTGAVQCRQWSWRDMSPWETWLFDWGTMHSQYYVSKEAGRIDKCLYFLFRMPELVYKVKPVVFVIPTSHKRGNSANRMAEICAKMASLLGMTRADNTTIAEDCLDKLPKGSKALVWPMPYCPSDATVALVKKFVENGGALYISGDLQFDENRKPTRSDRLEKICGVKPIGQPEFGDVFPKPPTVQTAGAEWKDPFWVNKLGKGVVYYIPKNVENEFEEAQTVSLYSRFLNDLGMKPLVNGGNSSTRCWTRPVADGGTIYTLLNGRLTGEPVLLTLPTAAGEFIINVPATRSSMVWVDGKKRVRAVVAQGDVRLNGKTILSADKMSIVAAITPGDIRDGKPLAVMSLWAGKVRLPAGARDTAFMGEIKDGKWRLLETRKAVGGVLSFDALQAREITVVGSDSDKTRIGKQVEDWIMRPWKAGN